MLATVTIPITERAPVMPAALLHEGPVAYPQAPRRTAPAARLAGHVRRINDGQREAPPTSTPSVFRRTGRHGPRSSANPSTALPVAHYDVVKPGARRWRQPVRTSAPGLRSAGAAVAARRPQGRHTGSHGSCLACESWRSDSGFADVGLLDPRRRLSREPGSWLRAGTSGRRVSASRAGTPVLKIAMGVLRGLGRAVGGLLLGLGGLLRGVGSGISRFLRRLF